MKIGNLEIGGVAKLLMIAGPCVLEGPELVLDMARKMKASAEELGLPLIFKASYDKANRTGLSSYRGPGITKGLEILKQVKDETGLLVISDVHSVDQVEQAAQVLDVIQIPALLCRQTDLLIAAAETGKPVNIKKGQFMAPHDMEHAIEKITGSGNDRVLITERGTMFGYNNLVVDMRSLAIMRSFGFPIIFDATHSVQLPSAGKGQSAGQPEFVAPLARAAVGAGVDGIFMEVHPQPDKALCDGANSLKLEKWPSLISILSKINAVVEDAK